MGFNWETILGLGSALVAGAILALRFIAPRTKNKVDDQVLNGLERIQPYLPAKGEGKAEPAVDAVSREKVRDHRDEKAVGFKQPK